MNGRSGNNDRDFGTCPNCPVGLQVERTEGDGLWISCPKCGHVEWRDRPDRDPPDDAPAP